MPRNWLVVLALAVVGVGMGGACASAPIKKTDQTSLVVAQTRVLEGCYLCLLDAREIFERVAVGRARPLLVERLFEVNVLIGLRERELALDSTEAFGNARALLAELPPTYQGAKFLEIAEWMPPDLTGTPRTELSPYRRTVPTRPRSLELKTMLAEAVVGGPSQPFREYLIASLDCLAQFANRADSDSINREIPPEAPALVKFRMATCPTDRYGALQDLLTEVPSFVEAGMFLARQASLQITAEYVKNRRDWLSAVYAVVPRSSSVTYALGTLAQTVGDCRTAIRYYEETIALKEMHEDAALQRVVCLGYLGQHVPAIEAATRIIDRGYYNLADAFYWRAWNHYQRKALEPARADIDLARKIMLSVQVLTLGGMIKFDQHELELAEQDLTGAIQMDPNQCVAHWYMGLVSFERQTWPETAQRFGRSATCYENAADKSVEDLEKMRVADVDPEFKASQIAGFEAAIKEDRDQQYASMLNAANGFARSDQIPTALEWIDRIPAEAAIASKAAELRKLLTGKIQ